MNPNIICIHQHITYLSPTQRRKNIRQTSFLLAKNFKLKTRAIAIWKIQTHGKNCHTLLFFTAKPGNARGTRIPYLNPHSSDPASSSCASTSCQSMASLATPKASSSEVSNGWVCQPVCCLQVPLQTKSLFGIPSLSKQSLVLSVDHFQCWLHR